MRNFLSLIAVIFCISFTVKGQDYKQMIDAGTFRVQEVIDEAETYFEGRDKGKGSGYKQFKRWEYMAERLMNDQGKIPSPLENYQVLQQYNAYLNETAGERQSLVDNWEELGPLNYSNLSSWSPGLGRITSFDVDRDNENHIIVGAETGGVWRTTDGGQNWNPLNDQFSNMSVFSVAIDPQVNTTYYFGSSNGIIFKSLDSGATWNPISSIGNSSVNKILVDPVNSDIMLATASYAGIYRTENGGLNWSNVTTDNAGFDIEFHPTNPQIVFASGYGFYKSIDGGITFAETSLSNNTDAQMIAVSADAPNRVYVIQADNGSFKSLQISEDSGETFLEIDQGGLNYFGYEIDGSDSSGQAPRDMDIAVNPTNADEVHIAGVQTWRSLDAGQSFQPTSSWLVNLAANANIGYCHADVDIIGFNGETLFVGTDGGFYKAQDTENITTDYFENISQGLGIRQWYKIGVSQTQDVIITGGSQDNGSSFYTETLGWQDWVGADGMEGFVSRANSNRMFAMIQYGDIYKTDNQGVDVSYLSWPGGGNGNWVTPFEEDPQDVNTIYAASNRVYKSTNNGNSWTAISQQLSRDFDNLKIAPSNNQIMYFSENSRIYRTLDGGETAWEMMPAFGGFANSIAVHPTNPLKIAVATNSISGKVVISNDGGETWIDYKKNLPNFSSLAVVWDDNGQDGLYVGMNYGIYYIDNMTDNWLPYSTNLPNVIINELAINNETNTLYAASYGRGLWASPLVEDLLGNQDFIDSNTVIVYPNPATNFLNVTLPLTTNVAVRLFDTQGKLLQYRRNLENVSTITINTETLAPGIYFVRLETANGKITKKFMKQ